MYDDPRSQDLASDDRTTLALAAGLVAALLGGAAWAVLVTVTHYEIGWLAWAIGGAVGWAMTRATPRRSRGLAITAAALALVGLAAGKAFVTAASAGPIANEIVQSEEMMEGALAWRLYDQRTLEPATLAAVDAIQAAGDTLTDALWADMRSQSAARLAAMSPEERQDLADRVAGDYVRQVGLVGGIRDQLSLFDALWIFLALGTAFRMLDAPAREPATVLAGAPE